MLPIPADIFTEPEVSPDDPGNLGPLRRLAGVWEADLEGTSFITATLGFGWG
jgi:hypothetical protein